MVRLTARYDGKVLVPEQPVNLPTGVPLQVTVHTGDAPAPDGNLLALEGIGADVWGGLDPVDYQRREREGWE